MTSEFLTLPTHDGNAAVLYPRPKGKPTFNLTQGAGISWAKWLSLKPLLEPLRFTDLSMFDWVVIGAQTATRQPGGEVPAFAPPFEWVARIVAQAREAGCKVHLKPNLLGKVGSHLPGMQLPDEYPGGQLPGRAAAAVAS